MHADQGVLAGMLIEHPFHTGQFGGSQGAGNFPVAE